jgi:hypothetical protein
LIGLVGAQKNCLGLEFHFSGGKKPKLKEPASDSAFSWKAGTIGFVLALLEYKLNGRPGNGFYSYSGDRRRSPAASACSVIEGQQWLQTGFGYKGDTHEAMNKKEEIARIVFKVYKSQLEQTIAFQIDSNQLPPSSVLMFQAGSLKPLSDEKIKTLQAGVLDQWEPHRKESPADTESDPPSQATDTPAATTQETTTAPDPLQKEAELKPPPGLQGSGPHTPAEKPIDTGAATLKPTTEVFGSKTPTHNLGDEKGLAEEYRGVSVDEPGQPQAASSPGSRAATPGFEQPTANIGDQPPPTAPKPGETQPIGGRRTLAGVLVGLAVLLVAVVVISCW